MPHPARKPTASLSLDLDNQWSYLKTHGDPAWESLPTYLPRVVPRVLEFLHERHLTITFFIVGRDATVADNAAPLRAIAEAGHEIANHSFNHDPWLHLYSESDLRDDISTAAGHIERVTGRKPAGFRGPGFSLSNTVLKVLIELGYRYDATVFPNLLNPLARAYFFATSNLSREQKEQRKALFGTWRDALKPVKPFRWSLPAGTLLELPVTTMPLVKVPIHMSYVLYLSKWSSALAHAYVRASLAMCRATRTEPSILLHPLDFMDGADVPELAFFPGMDLDLNHKLAVVSRTLAVLAEHFDVVTTGEHVARVLAREHIREIELEAAAPETAG